MNHRLIALTKSAVAKVSCEDWEAINEYSWYLQHGGGYAARTVRILGTKRKRVEYMHRVVTNAPADMRVDHINGDRLDNRRENLRVCTASQNLQNQPRARGRIPYKGVTLYTGNYRNKPYVAWLGKKNLGYFATPEEAAREYDKHAAREYGEFAVLNFGKAS